MYKILGLLLFFLLLAILSGCALSSGLVKDYIRENISESPCVIKHKGKNKWTAYFSDKPDYIFEIWITKYYAMFNPIPKRILRSNFNNKFALYYFNEYIKIHESILSQWDNDYPLHGRYSTAEEAAYLANDIIKYFEYTRAQKYPFIIESLPGGSYLTGAVRYLTSVEILIDYESPNLVDGKVFPYDLKILYHNYSSAAYSDYDIEKELRNAIEYAEYKIKAATIKAADNDNDPYDDKKLGVFYRDTGGNYYKINDYKIKNNTVSILVYGNSIELEQCVEGLYKVVENINALDALVRDLLRNNYDLFDDEAAAKLNLKSIVYRKNDRFELFYDNLPKGIGWDVLKVFFDEHNKINNVLFDE